MDDTKKQIFNWNFINKNDDLRFLFAIPALSHPPLAFLYTQNLSSRLIQIAMQFIGK